MICIKCRSTVKSEIFFTSDEFGDVIFRVAGDDVQSFRNNNEWLENHPADALLFRNVEDCWNGLKATYIDDFSGLVYGELPDEQQILETLTRIKERMMAIEWKITVNDNES